jgi:uncharacterized protein (TIGR02145 family)
MKKLYFLFVLFAGVTASAQLSVSNMQADYAAKKITFTVSWTTAPENNKIWLLADYRKIENNAETGSWSRAPIAAATKTAGVGSASTVSGNTQGFWLNTSGSSSSATVEATLNLPVDVTQFNWCVYGFNAPPHAVWQFDGTYQLHGTKPFTVNGGNLTAEAAVYSGDPPITAFTDATGCPGIWDTPGINQPQGSCTFTQPPLVNTFAAFPANYSASTFVRLMDERDRKNYTVVKMPDGKWWMAQNLNYQGTTQGSYTFDLYWDRYSNRANNTAFTTAGNGKQAIGSFWCPAGVDGAQATVSSANKAGCTLYGALYTYETAMMVDGKWSDELHNNSNFVEPVYSTNTTTGNTNNGGRGATKRGICPPNWHVPTDAEWNNMLNLSGTKGSNFNNGTGWLGANNDAGETGARLKAKCTCPSGNTNCVDDTKNNWRYTSTASNNGTDVYGFRELPSGFRGDGGADYVNRGNVTCNWSSSASNDAFAWSNCFQNVYSQLYRAINTRSYGFSVRCVRD